MHAYGVLHKEMHMTDIKDKFNKLHPKPKPFSLRLSFEERKRLEHDSAGLPLGEYIRQRLFDKSNPKRQTRGKFPVKDHKLLSQVLGKLGATRLANNLNQIAYSINTGSFEFTAETRAAILQACADIYEMRKLLMKALGLKDC